MSSNADYDIIKYPIHAILNNGDNYVIHETYTELSGKNIKVMLLRSTSTRLVRMSIPNNPLIFFPPIYSLKYLDCSNCKLRDIPALPNLEKLICKNNTIIKLHPMPKITYLDCSDNPLTTLPNMPCVKYLVYTRCPILYLKADCKTVSAIISNKRRSSSVINGKFSWVTSTPILLNWSNATIATRPSTRMTKNVYKFLFNLSL